MKTQIFLPTALVALSIHCAAQTAESPTLSLISEAPNGLVSSEKNTLYIKVFSWTAKKEPLEIRLRALDWNGAEIAKTSQNIDFGGNSSVAVPLVLPKYGPYEISVGLYRPGTEKPLREEKTRLIRPAPNGKLDAQTREKSWIGVNTHYNAPWESLAKIGVHHARDYSWGWLGEDNAQKPPMSSNGVDFAPTWKNAQNAGITILPLISHGFYNADKTGWIDDPEAVSAGYEKLARAFPEARVWEVDNEPEYAFTTGKADIPNYRRYLAAANAGLKKSGTGAQISLYGTPGVFPENAAALLKPLAGAPDVKDAFGVVNYHYYTGNQPPETGTENTNIEGGFAQIPVSPLDLQREINELSHAAGKQAWLTEIGWDVTNGFAVGERLQATYLPRAFLLSRWLETDRVFWYFDRDAPGTSKFSSCGLFDANWLARPSAATFAALSSQTALATPAGSLDWGADRYAVVLKKPAGGFVIGAWTVKGRYPAPAQLAQTTAFDVWGNPVKSPDLSPEVTYYHLEKLPAAWEAQRQTQLLSRRIVIASAGASAPIEIAAPGAILKWELPAGVSATAWKSAGKTETSTLTLAPEIEARTLQVTAIATGQGWTRRFPIEILVRPAAAIQVGAYTPGETLKAEIRTATAQSQTAQFTAPGAQITPANGAVSSQNPLAFSIAAPANARGPLPLSIGLSGGARQTEWLRPRLVEVPRAQNAKIDAQFAETPEKARLDARFFALSEADFAPEVSLSWSPDGLIVGAKLPAEASIPTDPQNFWDWTALEIFLDTNEKGTNWGPGARQFYFVPTQIGDAWKLAAGEFRRGANLPKTTFDDARFPTAIRAENGVLHLETLIPTAVLGSAPSPNSNFRAAISMRRVSKTQTRAEAIWPAPKTQGILDGRNWGLLKFGE